MSDRDPLLGELAAAWRAWDPMPPELPDNILTAIAMDDIDVAYELLTLVERSESLLGVRSSADGRTLIEFSANGVHVLLRVAEDETGRRVDGWVEPGRLTSATLTVAKSEHVARVSSASRFEVDALPPGLASLSIDLIDGTEARRFLSPHFEI